ncbi:tRNA (adenosine(37)-N6)-dimethylallyltransferase MiaA [Viridibacillus sp. YIM B01967]|uniref:tRNA dimethylallyltransferase n=1 Tax=Viridibacillus soli TaxID=2798301 RepID=A0ABS1H4F9_9BACL|nr:tRNA (adenosine(37)-N6)-dimethylallyltransferase MiaA [Viridibacillus soli]MBK3494305.1 tRNA (adenosine(37)-N6)-dimethylallyltransferase MiaA [Viridibacillus soli]
MRRQDLDVIAIVGPTASGKTALSIELAKQLNGEIINGDSMQIYKELNIGTAKITEAEMGGIPHHLLSIKEPTESFSVAEYQQLVRERIDFIRAKGKFPIIVGGTGLYIQAVLFDYRFTEEKIDEVAREAYYTELSEVGPEAMHAKLAKLDPKTAETIHPNNTRRVIRALEMVEQSGVAKSSDEQNQGNKPLYKHLIMGLNMDRELLYDRINKRVDLMLEQGLLAEVEALWKKDIRDVQSVQAIGYKEIYAYFDGKCYLENATEQLKQNSRRYAKRQLTYFRNKMDVRWFNSLDGTEKIIREILEF